jgi:hypothetical protein
MFFGLRNTLNRKGAKSAKLTQRNANLLSALAPLRFNLINLAKKACQLHMAPPALLNEQNWGKSTSAARQYSPTLLRGAGSANARNAYLWTRYINIS